MDILFPYSLIPRGSRIVIYGADLIGLAFYEQIKSTSHAEVICFIDDNPVVVINDLNVYKQEWLGEHEEEFDYVLIANTYCSKLEQIRRTLCEIVNKDRIIADGYEYAFRYAGIVRSDDIDGIINCLSNYSDKPDYYTGVSIPMLLDKMNLNSDFGEKLVVRLKELYDHTASYRLKSLIIYLILKSRYVDKTFFKKACDFVLTDFDKGTFHKIKTMLCTIEDARFRFPNILYEGFYDDVRSAMQQYTAMIYEKREEGVTYNRRIAIRIKGLYGKNHHMVKILMSLSHFLVEKGWEVGIFVEDLFMSKKDWCVNNVCGSEQEAWSSRYIEENKKLFDCRVKLSYSVGSDMRECMLDHVDRIMEYGPCCILSYTSSCSLVTNYLYNFFNIIDMPSCYAGTTALFHYMTCANVSAFNKLNEDDPWLNDDQKLVEVIPQMISHNCNVKYNRKQKGWKETDFICITVGNRLNLEVTEEFVRPICRFIRENKNVKWIFVGANRLDVLNDYKDLVDSNRIEFIPYEDELFALYEIVDVYLNPNRIGAGTSIAWAIEKEIPVLSCMYCGAGLFWLGDQNVIHGDYSMMAELLRDIYNSEETKRKLIEQMKKRRYLLNSYYGYSQLVELIENC